MYRIEEHASIHTNDHPLAYMNKHCYECILYEQNPYSHNEFELLHTRKPIDNCELWSIKTGFSSIYLFRLYTSNRINILAGTYTGRYRFSYIRFTFDWITKHTFINLIFSRKLVSADMHIWYAVWIFTRSIKAFPLLYILVYMNVCIFDGACMSRHSLYWIEPLTTV